MENLEDIEVYLNPAQAYSAAERIIEVDVSSRFNTSQYSLQPYISFNQGAFNYARIDSATGKRLVFSIKNDVVLLNSEEEIVVQYTATSFRGDTVKGRVLFPALDFDITAAPIDISLDACCSMPEVIKIDVRDYNAGRPVSLTEVGSNDEDAGTITLTDVDISDYDDDYDDDFGSDLHKTITYTLDKETAFWKTLGAVDRFEYTISYKGKTAIGTISIRLTNS
jgi:hypothetical protein